MSLTSRFMRGALALTLASVSVVALSLAPAFAKESDADQTLEDLLGVAPEADTGTQGRSLRIRAPEPELKPELVKPETPPEVKAPEMPASEPAARSAALPPADRQTPPVSAIATPETPFATPVAATPEPEIQDTAPAQAPQLPTDRMPSTLLRKLAGQPATAPEGAAKGSPIGMPKALPQLVAELSGKQPVNTSAAKAPAAASAEAASAIEKVAAPAFTPAAAQMPVMAMADPAAMAPEPEQALLPEPMPEPMPEPERPATPALPSAKAAELGVAAEPATTASLFPNKGNPGELDISAAELLGEKSPARPAQAGSPEPTRPAAPATPVQPTVSETPMPPVTAEAARTTDATGKTPSVPAIPVAPRPDTLKIAANDSDQTGKAPASGELIGRITFPAFNSTPPAFVRDLIRDKILPTLQGNPALKVAVSGYADWTPNGSVDASTDIGQRRAENITQFLRDQGIAPERLQTRGIGVDFRPGAPRDRVDITVIEP